MTLQNWANSRWNQWITRRIPRAQQITLRQRQLFIFPSRSGLALLVLLLVQLLIAINYENNLVYALVFLLATVLVITIHLTFANLYLITITGTQNTPIFLGESGAVQLKVTTRSHRRYDVHFKNGDTQALLQQIDPQDSAAVSITVTPTKRGLFTLGRLRVETEYPFGLLRCWSWIDVSKPLWVYPRPLTPPEISQSVDSAFDHSSIVSSQSGDDLYSFRPYRSGDPIKNIHWPSVARGGEPQITVMASNTGGGSPTLDFDDYPEVDVETRLSWLCTRVLAASRDNLTYGLKLPSMSLAPSSGAHHRDEALMMLAKFERNSGPVLTSDD